MNDPISLCCAKDVESLFRNILASTDQELHEMNPKKFKKWIGNRIFCPGYIWGFLTLDIKNIARTIAALEIERRQSPDDESLKITILPA